MEKARHSRILDYAKTASQVAVYKTESGIDIVVPPPSIWKILGGFYILWAMGIFAALTEFITGQHSRTFDLVGPSLSLLVWFGPVIVFVIPAWYRGRRRLTILSIENQKLITLTPESKPERHEFTIDGDLTFHARNPRILGARIGRLDIKAKEGKFSILYYGNRRDFKSIANTLNEHLTKVRQGPVAASSDGRLPIATVHKL